MSNQLNRFSHVKPALYLDARRRILSLDLVRVLFWSFSFWCLVRFLQSRVKLCYNDCEGPKSKNRNIWEVGIGEMTDSKKKIPAATQVRILDFWICRRRRYQCPTPADSKVPGLSTEGSYKFLNIFKRFFCDEIFANVKEKVFFFSSVTISTLKKETY